MAKLWHRHEGNRLFEVRSAGQSRRLYINGVLHTQFHAGHFFTGCVWDLLSLSSINIPNAQIKLHVLILGVGGGCSILQIKHLFPHAVITAVDLSDASIEASRKYFNTELPGVSFEIADGTNFVTNYRGPKFDLIIDDMFVEKGPYPERVASFSLEWVKQLKKHLTDQGCLAFNFSDRQELLKSELDLSNPPRILKIKGVQSLSTPTCDNRVIWIQFHKPTQLSIRKQLKKWEKLPVKNLKVRKRQIYKFPDFDDPQIFIMPNRGEKSRSIQRDPSLSAQDDK